MPKPDMPGALHRLRARYAWFDHALKTYQVFDDARGMIIAAGISYYTIFAVFPLLMVGFAVVGFALTRQPGLLAMIDDRIRASFSGDLAGQLVELMNAAIASRASVGVIGLATALWVGLSWMWHLREALGQMWQQDIESAGFLRTKLSDLAALVWAFAVTLATFGLTALGNVTPMAALLDWLDLRGLPGVEVVLRTLSLVTSLLVSWLYFTWMIARLPRKPTGFVRSMRAGLMAAVGFELFKQVASIYLQIVLRSPAGITFGPVLGLMVFVFVTACLVLFATAWAATAPENLGANPVDLPLPGS